MQSAKHACRQIGVILNTQNRAILASAGYLETWTRLPVRNLEFKVAHNTLYGLMDVTAVDVLSVDNRRFGHPQGFFFC